jgi:hypothetical protein
MTSHSARRLTRALLLTVLTTVGVTSLASSAYATPNPKISFSDIAFDTTTVDVSGGYATVHVAWSVTDSNPAATSLSGAVSIQELDGGQAVGPAQVLHFWLPAQFPPVFNDPDSTIASSHYTSDFLVLQFAASTNPVWRVTKVSASDDAGTSKRIDGDLADLQVTGATVDTTPPEVLMFVPRSDQHNVVVDTGSGVVLHYQTVIDDLDTGFWKGRVVLAGPGGTRLTVPIVLTTGADGFLQCGLNELTITTDVFCDVDVTIPTGSPSGAWTVDSIQVTNNIGLTRRYTGTDLSVQPIHATRNDTVTASDFSLTPTEVNNWRDGQTITLSMRVAGAQQGLSSVVLQQTGCAANTQTPAMAADGTVTIPIFFAFTEDCTVNGIAITDGAGNVAAYGSYYGLPPLNLATIRTPDTTKPVALTAVVSPSTRAADDPNHNVNVDITVDDDGLSPLSQYSVTFYDANGISVGGGSGGISQPPPGGVVHLLGVVNLVPGTYTVGFTIRDRAGNFSQYGYPNMPDHPAPSGPLVFTVVAS